MLGPKPWRVTSGPNMGEAYVLASKDCQGHAKAYNGLTPRKTAAIEVQHNGCDLLNTLETHTRRIAYTPSR
jgi:hypothetical protein